MVSTSPSSRQNSFKYDVFLSFRGEDTRKNFVDHLYDALELKSIDTYKDDKKIKKGKRINEELIKSIEESRLYVIVFSKNYASSSWCLDELVKIMECQKMIEHTAYPVFYDVEPAEVRKQCGAIGEALAKYKEHEAVGKWRDALSEAADLAGWELKNTLDGHEAQFIKKVVQQISLELRPVSYNVDGKLVGMETRVKDVVSSLEIDIDDVRMLGIKGKGGGGKTTLARSVFDQISFQFEGSSFVENVREVSKASLGGLKLLQKQILSDVLYKQDITVNGVYEGKNMLKKTMCCRKVLLVLDDVDHIDQLQALAGDPSWFKLGSKVIITTRDEQVLAAHRVNLIIDVNLLSDKESVCLFSRYAFGTEIPIQGYEELSEQVVCYAAGLPLTITVLGSFLCGKDELEWIDALERLKTIPLKETLEILEISYNDLEEDYKEIFLDVACALKGWEKERAIRVLESCGFRARNGLRVLEQKSLLTVSDYELLGMHDHLEELGKNIVRRLHPNEPYRHSRLWIQEEIEDILVEGKDSQATRCINLWMLNPIIVMKGLRNMKELVYLDMGFGRTHEVYYPHFDYDDDNIDEDSLYLPNSLRYLRWNGYPFKCLPKSFKATTLVGLEMLFSCMEQLWEDGEKKVLKNLRFIDLQFCSLRTLDIGLFLNLERLNLNFCFDLVELHMPVERFKLEFLKLWHSKLRTLDLSWAQNLNTLNVGECKDLVELNMPVESPKLKHLNLKCSKLKTLNLMRTLNLETLYLECEDLLELRMPLESLKLKNLCLQCSTLKILNLTWTLNIETLSLKQCVNLIEFRMPVESLKLKHLHLQCPRLKTINLTRTLNIETLVLQECEALVELHMPTESFKLISLELINCFKLTSLDLTWAQNLDTLNIKKCQDLVELHMPVESLKLKSINIHSSKLRTLYLGMSPYLECLDLPNCYNLVEIHAPDGCLKNLVHIYLSGCVRFKHFRVKQGFSMANSSAELHLTARSLDICPLHPDNNLPKFRFGCIYTERLPSSTGNLEKLISFGLCACTNLASFSASICGLQYLRKLTLEGSLAEVPKDIDQLESLEELTLSSTKIKHLPDSICMLKHLKILQLKHCSLLEQLPKDLGGLECLEELQIMDCMSLRDIPSSVCEMKRLKCIHLPYCILVEKLPEETGRLKCLKEINIKGTCISHLPRGILKMKGLIIIGSSQQLESYGFTSVMKNWKYTAFCYI